jgi:hypothetical protein
VKALIVAYLFLDLIVLPAKADIIYFKDGMKTICQEKAWEENGQIKCEFAGWVLTYPKEDILRIVKTNPIKQTTPPEKKRRVDQIVTKDSSTPKSAPPKTDGIAFYNPRRPYKYWTGPNSKHKSYREAIQALAKTYHRSPEWIQTHMGDSNDLLQIHQRLASPDLNRETDAVQPPPLPPPGIPFYNPRRSFPYWTSKTSKHKSYDEAIKTLAEKYGKSPQWVQDNMGNSNDLDQIHQNLKIAEIGVR